MDTFLYQKTIQLDKKIIILFNFSAQRRLAAQTLFQPAFAKNTLLLLFTLFRKVFKFLYSFSESCSSSSKKYTVSQKNAQMDRLTGCTNLSTGTLTRVSFFVGRGMPLDDLEFSDERIEEVFEGETPRWKKGGYAYSNAAKRFYGKIRALRDRGFSFIQICDGFEKMGLLATGSKPYSLRQAFFREIARRNRTSELLREIRDGPPAGEQAREASPARKAPSVSENVKSIRTPNIAPPPARREPPSAATIPESEEAMQERIKRMTSSEINTGTGKIVKHHDGTFDY